MHLLFVHEEIKLDDYEGTDWEIALTAAADRQKAALDDPNSTMGESYHAMLQFQDAIKMASRAEKAMIEALPEDEREWVTTDYDTRLSEPDYEFKFGEDGELIKDGKGIYGFWRKKLLPTQLEIMEAKSRAEQENDPEYKDMLVRHKKIEEEIAELEKVIESRSHFTMPESIKDVTLWDLRGGPTWPAGEPAGSMTFAAKQYRDWWIVKGMKEIKEKEAAESKKTVVNGTTKTKNKGKK